MNAISANDFERTKLLVEQGADKDEEIKGQTPLRKACQVGNLEVVQYLVQQGFKMETNHEWGWTPLFDAILNDHPHVVSYLLEQGSNRDKVSSGFAGFTPLHLAAEDGQLEIAMMLMSYGANLNVMDNNGRLPIDHARTEEMKQAIRDEPRRRMDHGHKRATEQDRHPNTAASSSTEEDEEGDDHSHKRPRLDEVVVLASATSDKIVTKAVVAEEDEDSEPSDDDNDEK